MAFTIEFDVSPAEAELDKIERKLLGTSKTASAAGKKTGAAYVAGMQSQLDSVKSVLSKAQNPDLIGKGREKNIGGMVSSYQHLIDLQSKDLQQLQKAIILEKERNDLRLAAAKTSSAARLKAETSAIRQQAALHTQVADAQARSVLLKSKSYSRGVKILENTKATNDAVEKRISAEAKLASAKSREVKRQQKATTLAEHQLRVDQDRAKISFSRSTSGKNLAKEVELSKIILKLEKERALLRAASTPQGKRAAQDLSMIQLKNKLLKEEQRLVLASSASYQKLQKRLAEVTAKRKAAEGGVMSHTASLKANALAVTKGYSALGRVEKSNKKATAAIRTTTKAIRENSVAVTAHKKHIDLAAQSTSAWRAGLAGLGSHMGIYTSSTILAASAVYGLSRAIKGSISIGTEFTGSMQRAFAVMGVGGAEAASLEGFVQQLGKTTVFTAKEVAEGLVFLGMAGQSMDEAMESLHPTLQLASIGMLEMARAADIVTNIMGGFQIDASDVKSVVDDMSTAVVSANMNIEQLGTSMSYVAPVAQAAGVGLEDVVAALEVLHNAGIKGSRAGTGLRRSIFNLFNTTTKGAKALKELGVITTDFAGNAKPLISILTELNSAGANLSQLGEIVGVRAAPALIQLVEAAKEGTGELHKLRAELDGNAGAANNLQKEIEDFLGADIKKLGAAFEDLGLIAFNEFEEDLRNLTKAATTFVKSLDAEDIRSFVNALELAATVVSGLVALFIGKKVVGLVGGLGTSFLATGKKIKSATADMKNAGKVGQSAGYSFVGLGNNVTSAGVKTAAASKSFTKFGGVLGNVVKFGGGALRVLGGLVGGPLGILASYVIGEGLFRLIDFFTGVSKAAKDASGNLESFLNTDSGKDSSSKISATKSKLKDLKDDLKEMQASVKSFEGLTLSQPELATQFSDVLGMYRKSIVDTKTEIESLTSTEKTQLDKLSEDRKNHYLESIKLNEAQIAQKQSTIERASAQIPTLEAGDTKTLGQIESYINKREDQIAVLKSQNLEIANTLASFYSEINAPAKDLDTPDLKKVSKSFAEQAKLINMEHKGMVEATSSTKAYTDAFKKFTEARIKFDKLDLSAGASVGSARAAQDERGLTEEGSKLLSIMGEQQEILKDNRSGYISERDRGIERTKKEADEIKKINSQFDIMAEKMGKLRVESGDFNFAVEGPKLLAAEASLKSSFYEEYERLNSLSRDITVDEWKNVSKLRKQYEKAETSVDAMNKKIIKNAEDSAKIETARQKRVKDLQKEFGVLGKNLSEIKDKTEDLNELQENGKGLLTLKEYNREMRKLVRLKEAAIAKSADSTYEQQAILGAKHGLEDYRDEITNVYDEVQGLASDSLQGLEDVFVEFAKTGKFEFTDLVNHIETELLRLGTRKFLMEPLTEMFNGAFGSGGQSGGGGFDLSGMFGSMFGGGGGSSSFASTPGIDLGSFGGSSPIQGGGGMFSGLLDSLWPFANGGEFEVGGNGGTDSQLVAFRASPNETVSVRTPNQQDDSRTVQVINHITIEAPNGNISKQSLNQLQTAIGSGIQRNMRRNT